MGKKTKKKGGKKVKTPKYGISALAKEMKIKEATARIKLRDAKVKKSGKSYGWNSPAEMKAVVAQLGA